MQAIWLVDFLMKLVSYLHFVSHKQTMAMAGHTIKVRNLKEKLLLTFQNNIQTHKRLKGTLFIRGLPHKFAESQSRQ